MQVHAIAKDHSFSCLPLSMFSFFPSPPFPFGEVPQLLGEPIPTVIDYGLNDWDKGLNSIALANSRPIPPRTQLANIHVVPFHSKR